jgi:hypothetical protein
MRALLSAAAWVAVATLLSGAACSELMTNWSRQFWQNDPVAIYPDPEDIELSVSNNAIARMYKLSVTCEEPLAWGGGGYSNPGFAWLESPPPVDDMPVIYWRVDLLPYLPDGGFPEDEAPFADDGGVIKVFENTKAIGGPARGGPEKGDGMEMTMMRDCTGKVTCERDIRITYRLVSPGLRTSYPLRLYQNFSYFNGDRSQREQTRVFLTTEPSDAGPTPIWPMDAGEIPAPSDGG